MKTFRKEDVTGKTAIDTSGTVRGKIVDVTFDLGGTVTLLVRGEDGKDIQVPLAKVTGISDHVVIRAETVAESSAWAAGTTCRFCGAQKPAGERWCPRCGKSQS